MQRSIVRGLCAWGTIAVGVVTGCDSPAPPSGLTLTPDSLVLSVRQRVQLSVVFADGSDRRLNFTTSDSTVASVTPSGLVEATGAGSAYVRAAAVGRPSAVDSAHIVVPGVRVSPNAATLPVRAALQLSWHVTGATSDSVHLQSTDSSIADVSGGGLVCAFSPGKAVIRVSSQTDPVAPDSTILEVLPSVNVNPGSPTVHLAALIDSAGHAIDSTAVRGRVSVSTDWDTPICADAFAEVLVVDGQQLAVAPAVRFGGVGHHSFDLDTRPIANGARGLADGKHQLTVLLQSVSSAQVLASTTIQITVVNGM